MNRAQNTGLRYVPKKVIILYTADFKKMNSADKKILVDENYKKDFFLQECDVKEVNGEYVQGQTLNIRAETIQTFHEYYQSNFENKVDHLLTGRIPSNMVNMNYINKTFMFFYPEQKIELLFRIDMEKYDSREVIIPNTLIQVQLGNKKMSSVKVYSFNNNHLIEQCYMNTNGTVCTGSASTEIGNDLIELEQNVYQMFFKSYFTEVHGDVEIDGYKDVKDFWLNHNFKRRFPYNKFKKQENHKIWSIAQTLI